MTIKQRIRYSKSNKRKKGEGYMKIEGKKELKNDLNHIVEDLEEIVENVEEMEKQPGEEQKKEVTENLEKVKEQIAALEEGKETETKKKEKGFSIFGITIWRMLAYFVIYSVLGFIVETIFAFFSEGVIESRKSFLYGPFCAIYGVGAVVMIVGLQKCKKNNFTLCLGGFLIGSVVEYLVSLIGELVFHVKWWDYSDMAFNLQGRICLTFSIAWAALGVFLIKVVNPIVDKVIDKIPVKVWKIGSLVIVIFMFIDWIVSSFAMQMFFMRIVDNHHIELKDGSEYIEICRDLYQEEWIKNIVDTFWNDEVMVKTFPNLRVTTKNGAVIYVSKLYPEIHPYYIKVFEPIHLEKFEFIMTKKGE